MHNNLGRSKKVLFDSEQLYYKNKNNYITNNIYQDIWLYSVELPADSTL